MQISAPGGARLVEVRSSVAGVAELHEMTMEGTTMKMRAVPGIELPAGKAVELKPGGYHVMLMDLKQPLLEGQYSGPDAGRRRQGPEARDARDQGAGARPERPDADGQALNQAALAGRSGTLRRAARQRRYRASAFSASLMPSLTPASGGSSLHAAAASRSL